MVTLCARAKQALKNSFEAQKFINCPSNTKTLDRCECVTNGLYSQLWWLCINDMTGLNKSCMSGPKFNQKFSFLPPALWPEFPNFFNKLECESKSFKNDFVLDAIWEFCSNFCIKTYVTWIVNSTSLFQKSLADWRPIINMAW